MKPHITRKRKDLKTFTFSHMQSQLLSVKSMLQHAVCTTALSLDWLSAHYYNFPSSKESLQEMDHKHSNYSPIASDKTTCKFPSHIPK